MARDGIIRPRSCTLRFRVMQIIGVAESAGFVGSNTTREFKTHKGAVAYQNELSQRQPYPVALQVGVVQWLSEDEANEWIEAHQGEHWE